ncbi:TPA: hypothetical protein PY061_000361 [Staphylococcus aureus]|uniref:hypothetical protein n=1 Tax=Staphylococcus aureus TaxID=1280 RepID=UPI00085C2992|nr:hypothetical protein [Staphylococcus aureus]HDD5587553.1 hypothetical protein [Staphylococcus aureus]HDM0436756.1 hypothetical protein [Staphylococcus aureus]HDM0454339.1 hypothetical protein [Staphylococcus aureus]HEG8555971.1 hypothetical protein [Staphylococcus aureus]HEG8689200.1 hypothetical protein [Staphylococcus aureus]
MGPQHSEIGSSQFLQAMQVGVGPQHSEIGSSQFLQAMQVGVGPQHREIGFPISTGNGSWGGTTK